MRPGRDGSQRARVAVLALAVGAFAGGAVVPLGTLEPSAATAAGSSAQTQPPATGGSACPASNPPDELLLDAGTPQTAQLDAAFASALQVTLANTDGCPVTAVAGTPVTFTAPAGGASATFGASGSSTVTVGADTSGNASAGTFTANDTPGSYQITAQTAYGSASFALTNTAAGIPATITAAPPTAQQAIADHPYTDPLSVRVLDANGQPVSGITVTFTLGGGGGNGAGGGASGGSTGSGGSSGAGATFLGGGSTATAETGSDGIADSSTFAANQSAGSFVAFATVSQVSRPASFQLLNLPARGARLTRIGSGRRTAAVGRPYRGRLRVRMRDAGGSPVIGATVTFTLDAASGTGGFSSGGTAGGPGAGGSFTNGSDTAMVITGAGGVAVSPAISANTVVGSFTAVATSTTTANVARFRLINLPGRGERLTTIGRAHRTATVGQPYRGRLRVRIRDAGGSPVIGATVVFTLGTSNETATGSASGGPGAGASFTNGTDTATVTTARSGIAVSPPFTANAVSGGFSAVATSATTNSVARFTLINRPGSGARLTVLGSSHLSATVAAPYARRLAIRLLDADRRPLIGATVTFTLSVGTGNGTGGGQPTPGAGSAGASFPGGNTQATETTNTNGIAISPRFAANSTAGSFTATALIAAANVAATFQLTNRPGAPASVTAGAGATQATTIGTPFPIPLAVTVEDVFGNPVPDAPVRFAAPTAGASGSFDGHRTVTVRTDQHGIAEAPRLTATPMPGGYIVIATAGRAPAAAFALVNQAP